MQAYIELCGEQSAWTLVPTNSPTILKMIGFPIMRDKQAQLQITSFLQSVWLNGKHE
jgi:hypothetical protein